MNVNYFKTLWRNSLVIVLFCFGLTSGWGQNIFISQYIETNTGSTPKGVEVFNAGPTDIVFSESNNLQIYQGTNGASCSNLVSITSGTLKSGEVWVIGTSDLVAFANDNGTNLSGTTTFPFTFNGDDALQLRLGGTLFDVFGTCGTDPGTAWSGGGVSTANENIQTLESITSGTTSNWTDPSLRFETIGNGSTMTGFGNAPYALTQSYTLTYTAGPNGAIDGVSPQTVQEGQSGTAVTAVPEEGYHFVNWSDDSTQNPRIDTNVTTNISVTANFAINTYTVTYDGNGADEGSAPNDENSPYNHGSLVTVLDEGNLVKEGHTFIGWATDAENPETIIAPGSTFIITSDVTLYAYWEDASKLAQTITFDAVEAKTYGDADFELSATSDSGLPISYTSTNTNVATIEGNMVTIVGAGSTDITAFQGGDDDYLPATPVVQTLIVNPKNLTISGVTVADKTYDGTTTADLDIETATLEGTLENDDVDFTVGTAEFASADAGSDIAVTATFSLTGTAAGNYTLTQPTLSGNILKAEQTVTLSDLNAYLGDEAITLPTVTDQGIAIEYISDNESVATVEGNVLNIVGLGTTEIFAGNNGSDNYEEFTGGFEITVTEAPLEPVTIAGWDFNSITEYGASPLIASVINENSEVGGLTRGSGVATSGSAATHGWGGNGWNVSDQTTAISNNKYVTFTVKAIDGYTLSLSSIDPFEYRRSNTGATQGMLQYSLNGTDFTDIQALNYSSSGSSGGVLEAIDLSSVSELQNVPSTTTVTFRIVNWGASNSTGTWYLYDVDNDSGVNDFSVNGHLSTTAPSYITWTTEDEWSNGTGPTIADDAVIEGDLTLTGDLSAKTLTVAAGGKITVPANKVLTVDGAIINEAGAANFVVENGGILIQNTDAENTGAITVKRNSNPMFRLDYTLWSSPVAGMRLVDFSNVSPTSPTAGNGTLWNRVYTLGEDAWEQVWNSQPDFENDTTLFEAGQGYLYRSPNAWVIRGNENGDPAQAYPGVFTGVPNNGTVNAATPYEFSSIGNPYPSPIDAVEFIANNDVEFIYFWTNTHAPVNGSYDNQPNNWAYFSAAVGGVSADGGALTPNGIIQPGQGFVAKMLNSSESVTFNNTMRTNDTSGLFFRAMNTERHRFWLNLSNEEVVFNQILVGYMDNATQGVDTGIDGKMFAYEGNALYSIIDNNEDMFVIQGRSLPFTASDVVALGFRAVNAGSFTISLANLDGLFADNQNIYLKDNFTQSLHNLKEGAYTFVSEEGIFNTRFEVVYQTTMSVENPIANNANWIVYSQENGYQIQTQGFELKSVQVFDLLGRAIYTASAEGTAHHIPSLGADSVYIVKVTTTDNVVLSKKVR